MLWSIVQVSLLNQEIIIEMIQSEVEVKLRNANDTRTFQEQVCSQKNLKQHFSLEVKNIYLLIMFSFDICMLQKVEYIQSTLTSQKSDSPVSQKPSGIVPFFWVECLSQSKTFPVANSSVLFASQKSLCSSHLLGQKTQKVPVNKMVRTDSSDPAGRLHAFLQPKPQSLPDKVSSLSVVR